MKAVTLLLPSDNGCNIMLKVIMLIVKLDSKCCNEEVYKKLVSWKKNVGLTAGQCTVP